MSNSTPSVSSLSAFRMTSTGEPAQACRICSHPASDAKRFLAREMMFGTREKFEYFECAACGCVQIAAIPDDLSPYYPPDYYSFSVQGRLKTLIKGPWLCDRFDMRTAAKRALAALPGVRLTPEWISRGKIPRSAPVLEIGSGSGHRLLAMRAAGYRDLTGVDPFIQGDIRYSNGVTVLKQEISGVSRRFRLVMMHHAFEHLARQFETLIEIKNILEPDGTLLIRIPVADSYAWRTYGVNWIGLDPPRHLFLHTRKSVETLAQQTGFRIDDMFHDSEAYQFWASEQYVRDIPLRDPRSYDSNKRGSIFSRSTIRGYEEATRKLNQEGQGDWAAFFLKIA